MAFAKGRQKCKSALGIRWHEEMSNNSQGLISFRPNRSYPMLLAAAGLFYIYVMQFPLNYFFFNAGAGNYYHLEDWFIAYGFVLISSLIFLLFMYIGMMGGAVRIKQIFDWRRKSDKRISLPIVLIIFGIFFLWSYAMFALNIGMTIYADFDPLPYRITGILFYGRLTLQPLLVSIIAYQYANSNRKWIIFLLIISLGAWVCVASGSRFISILFALPLLLLLTGKWKYLILLLCLIGHMQKQISIFLEITQLRLQACCDQPLKTCCN
jgi:hypothetical protein